MEELLRKPDWIPYYVQRMKASRAYRTLEDFQFGWYSKLLVELADSDNPGYLPNDVGKLWSLAGARTEKFFRERGGMELVACHFKPTADGLWIYNERMLEVLQEQQNKRRRKRNPSSLILDTSLCIPIYDNYPRKEGRRKALEEINRAIHRLACEKQYEKQRLNLGVPSGDQIAAAAAIHQAVTEFANSPAGSKRGQNGEDLRPHPSTWFHQDRFLDDRSNWNGGSGNGKFANLDDLYGDEK